MLPIEDEYDENGNSAVSKVSKCGQRHAIIRHNKTLVMSTGGGWGCTFTSLTDKLINGSVRQKYGLVHKLENTSENTLKTRRPPIYIFFLKSGLWKSGA